MDRTNARSRIKNTFADPAMRSVLLFTAVLVNFVLAILNLFHVFDRAPAWVGIVVWIVVALVGLVFIGVLTYTVRDWRQRRHLK